MVRFRPIWKKVPGMKIELYDWMLNNLQVGQTTKLCFQIPAKVVLGRGFIFKDSHFNIEITYVLSKEEEDARRD